jgi:hypothetical protein
VAGLLPPNGQQVHLLNGRPVHPLRRNGHQVVLWVAAAPGVVAVVVL